MVGGKRRRTMKGGMYGFSGEVITPGTLAAKAAYTGPVNSAGGAIPDPTDPAGGYTGVGGRRSRKGRKGRKGSKKTRKMRGGAGSISMGTVGHSFEGKGVAGLADHSQYTTQGNAF
jgi:hypothetical protein